jgi:heterokaryon incompatibility protein (HET)
MRLIHSTTLQLQEFTDNEIPPYAILSHTWGRDEVSFQDMQLGAAHTKDGYAKVTLCAQQAINDCLLWIWVDTCCIDKTSSAELSEAINSMYRWYKEAKICYAYLSDVASLDIDFAQSRWFSRGWTLQELIAPSFMKFFGRNWQYLGLKQQHPFLLSRITGIDVPVLQGKDPAMCSVSRRMSWASGRQTTRTEDIAYCLMGLFDVNMPLLYGEGDKAFIRLQQEIMKESDDHSLFAWIDPTAQDTASSGLLARSPKSFLATGDFTPLVNWESNAAYFMTNKGISLQLLVNENDWGPKIQDGKEFPAVLGCCKKSLVNKRAIIYLKCISIERKQYTRIKLNTLELTDSVPDNNYLMPTVNVRQKLVLPTLQVPVRLSGVRIDHSLFTEHTGMELLAEYPRPIDLFLKVCSSDLDYRDGAFGVLGFGRKSTGLKFAIVLGFINFMGPCCKIVRDLDDGSHVDKLRFVLESCERDSLTILAPDDTIVFSDPYSYDTIGWSNKEPGAITIWKEDVNDEAVVVVKLHSTLSYKIMIENRT